LGEEQAREPREEGVGEEPGTQVEGVVVYEKKVIMMHLLHSFLSHLIHF